MDFNENKLGEGNTDLIINAQGQTRKDIEEIKNSDILIPEGVNPTSSQNDVPLDQYNEEKVTIPTHSAEQPDGTNISNPAWDHESQSWQATPESEEIAKEGSYIKATEKKEDDTTREYWDKEVDGAINDAYKRQEEARDNGTQAENTVQEAPSFTDPSTQLTEEQLEIQRLRKESDDKLTKGEDRGYFKNENGQFATREEGTFRASENQLEEFRKEMNEDLEEKVPQNTGIPNIAAQNLQTFIQEHNEKASGTEEQITEPNITQESGVPQGPNYPEVPSFTDPSTLTTEEPQTIENPEIEEIRNEMQELTQRLNDLSTRLTQLTQAEEVIETPESETPEESVVDSEQAPVTEPPQESGDSTSGINEQPPVQPPPPSEASSGETNQSPEVQPDNTEIERKERNAKRWLMVAGVAAGGATGILGGAQVASVGLVAVGVTRLANWGVGKLASRNSEFLTLKLQNETNPEERTKLEKRLNTWNKVSNISKKTSTFLKGATYGLIGSMMISNLFMGGQGLMTGSGSNTITPELTPKGDPNVGSTSPSKIDIIAPQGSVEIPDTNLLESLIQNNHLDVSRFGWDYQDLGWNGPRLFVPQADVVTGGAPQLQGEFLKELFGQGVTEELLMGQEAGKIFNQGLMDAVYRGGDMASSVQNTAEALKALGQ